MKLNNTQKFCNYLCVIKRFQMRIDDLIEMVTVIFVSLLITFSIVLSLIFYNESNEGEGCNSKTERNRNGYEVHKADFKLVKRK